MDLVAYLRDETITLVGPKMDDGEYFYQELSWQVEEVEACFADFNSDDTLKLVLDFIDENIRSDWAPKLLPWERQGYEKRQIEKRHREGAAFVKIIWLPVFQENGEGRKEQQILICSQMAGERLSHLLALLENKRIVATAIYSYSFLLKDFFLKKVASHLRIPRRLLQAPLFFVIRQDRFSFRQIFFQAGEVEISRHIEVEETPEDQQVVASLINETRVAVKYLYNQKIVPIDSEVSLVYVDLFGQDEQLALHFFQEKVVLPAWDREQYSCHAVQANQIMHFPEDLPGEQVLPIFLYQYLMVNRVAGFYRHAYIDKIVKITQTAQFLRALLVLLISGFAFYITILAVNTYVQYDKSSILDNRLITYQQEKERLQKRTQLKYDAEDIKATVDFSEKLDHIRQQGVLGFPAEALITVLSRHPHILMSELKTKQKGGIEGHNTDIELSGWVFPFKDEYHPLVEWVDALVEDLAHQAVFSKVTLTKEPLDRSLKKALLLEPSSKEKMDALPFKLHFQAKGQS